MASENEKKLKVKYSCVDNHSREQGLMFKPPLKYDECAFFIFPYAQQLSFWNKNVEFDIYVIFADENFNIVNCETLRAQQTEPVKSQSPCKFVIEVNRENFGNIYDYNSFLVKGNSIILLKNKLTGNNFGKDDFQKLANVVYKTIR
jgi:uncharacterized membrane protein (UPF0127 family)